MQNLKGTYYVLITGSGRKTEKGDWSFYSAKSKLPLSHENSSGCENDDCEIDELTIQRLKADDKLRHKVQKELIKLRQIMVMDPSNSNKTTGHNKEIWQPLIHDKTMAQAEETLNHYQTSTNLSNGHITKHTTVWYIHVLHASWSNID